MHTTLAATTLLMTLDWLLLEAHLLQLLRVLLLLLHVRKLVELLLCRVPIDRLLGLRGRSHFHHGFLIQILLLLEVAVYLLMVFQCLLVLARRGENVGLRSCGRLLFLLVVHQQT